MSKNVAVFVDVANIFYAAKAAGVDIDYVTLLKSASAGRDLVRAYAYTGLDPDNENQRNFHSFLARNGYKVVSKDIRKYGDGKVKANLDIELVVDMMKTSRNLDIAIVVSGDGDFAPAIRAVQEMGVRVEVISFRGNTSSDLIDVADQFTDIIHLAKVEKASSRSGRRVAGDDEDLSMTEVPDKQTEGVGGRGRGRGRSRGRDVEPAVRTGRRAAEPAAAVLTSSGAPLVVLPGEKLSRIAPAAATMGGEEPVDSIGVEGVPTVPAAVDAEGEGAGRRRRRRGGRGRGRGRRTEGVELAPGTEPELVADDDEEFVEAPRGPRTTPFGSVWDSQLGVPSPAPARLTPLPDEDDLDEPEIPEYLIAERKNRGRPAAGGGAGGRGGRGNRAAYAAAMDRERFGRGGGGGGINRYPDVSARERPRDSGPRDGGFVRRDRPDRGDRPERHERVPRPAGGEPWSEVPPELEAMLRAQLSTRPKVEPVAPPRPERPAEAASPAEVHTPEPAATSSPPRARPRSRVGASAAAGAKASPKRRTTAGGTRKATSGATDVDGGDSIAGAAAPKRRATSRAKAAPAAATASAGVASAPDGGGEAPKRRVTRRKPSTESPPA